MLAVVVAVIMIVGVPCRLGCLFERGARALPRRRARNARRDPRPARCGPRAVLQANVDLAADEFVAAGIRPYPQLLARATGGSLSTLTPMFEDWWQRFAAARQPGTERTRLAGPLRTTLHLRHLLSALEDAARAELGLKDAHPPLENAVLGEREHSL